MKSLYIFLLIDLTGKEISKLSERCDGHHFLAWLWDLFLMLGRCAVVRKIDSLQDIVNLSKRYESHWRDVIVIKYICSGSWGGGTVVKRFRKA